VSYSLLCSYLASFYTIALPKIPYEIMTRVANPLPDPFHLLDHSTNESNVIGRTTENYLSSKRRMDQNEENENEFAEGRAKK
jgi:hypothetical protein